MTRRWLVFGVRPPPGGDADGLITEGLLALGGRAVWEERGRLLTHLPEPEDPDAFVRSAEVCLRSLSGWRDLVADVAWQDHEDWAESWKRGLAPRRVTDRLIVTPSWETPEAGPEDVVITVDPGMAFGNAEHGTTRGCLRLLDGVLAAGERVLDVGTGSGILSVAAARLGAEHVIALDSDPLACQTARENLERNGVTENVTVIEAWADGSTLGVLAPFDGVLANLESVTLHDLLPALSACVREGGWMIFSGILDEELDGLLRPAAARGLSAVTVDADGEWRSALLRRCRATPGRAS